MKTFQKYLSIHSEDRDLSKYPNASKFAFELPVEYKNVYALRLSDISLPSLYAFSEDKNNLTFYVDFPLAPKVNRKITISPGNYNVQTMLTELTYYLANPSDPTTAVAVNYDNVRNTFVFSSDRPDFKLVFYNQPTANYLATSNYLPVATYLPIANYLGFQQMNENTALQGGTGTNQYNNFHCFPSGTSSTKYYIEAPNQCSLQGDPFIYMELDLFNNIDELTPYTQQNKVTAKHNLAFAKIPTRFLAAGETYYVTKELQLSNVFYSDPPLERIQKFQCKFRYHDGTLVDFGASKFSFTIEIIMIREYMAAPEYYQWA